MNNVANKIQTPPSSLPDGRAGHGDQRHPRSGAECVREIRNKKDI